MHYRRIDPEDFPWMYEDLEAENKWLEDKIKELEARIAQLEAK